MNKNYLNLDRSSVQNSQFMRDIFIDKIFEHAKKDKNLFLQHQIWEPQV